MLKRILAMLLVMSVLLGIPVMEVSAAEEDDVLRMIVIGNSHGYDSTQLLWKVYQTQNPDKKVQIGAMYYSGCSVEQHLNFIRQESAVYDYKRTDENGNWVVSNDVTMDTGLLDQQWDVVILMQGSGRGGVDHYYYINGQIQKLQEYVRSKLEVEPQFYWNTTWVPPLDTYFQDPDYITQPPEDWADTLLNKSNGDQLAYYRRFASGAGIYLAPDPTFTTILTPGTAIQYANNMLGQTDRDLYRDYTHLSDFGRLIAAHTLYSQIEGLTKLDSVNMDRVEKSLRHSKFQQYGDLIITEEQKQVVVDAVNHTLKSPFDVPDIPVTAQPCKHCTAEPVWTAWDGGPLPAADGHYYLTADVSLSQAYVLPAGNYTVSINLNGHSLHANGRAFEVGEGVILSIMDSIGTGGVSAKGISGQDGAVALIHSGGTLALYGGTLTMPAVNNGGSVICGDSGNIKICGGTVTDGNASTTEDVCMTGSSTVYARDGELSSLLTDGPVTVSRYAVIGSLTPGNGTVLSELLTVSNFYAGSVGLNLSVTAEVGLDLGGGDEQASLNGECVYLLGDDRYGAVLQDSQLVLTEKAYCQHCKKLATWHAITESGRSEMVQRSGHFYLGFDATTYSMTERILFNGTEVCLDLNGKGYNGTIRAFAVDNGATLNVMGTGRITGRGSCGDLSGSTIYVAKGGTLNLYGGTLKSLLGITEKRTADKGGVVAVEGTFNMYGGKVDPTSSYTPEWWPAVGGAVYVGPSGTVNMSGGQILSGEVSDTAPCVYVDRGGEIRLTGDPDIEELYFAESSKETLTVADRYTGTVSLRYPADVLLEDLVDVGNSQNADVSDASISFADAQGKTVTVSGTDLLVSEYTYTYGTCEVCGPCQWIPVTDADVDAFGKSNMPPGHYRLTEDLYTTQKSLNNSGTYPGTFCLDLAGHTFSGTTRGFIVYEGATLNIMDSVGGGVVEGCGTAAVAGGGIYVTKNSILNVYGGTIRSNPVNSETRSGGGAVTVNGGTFHLYGGTVEGSAVTGNGGAIQVKSDSDVPGTFTAAGGQVTAGTAGRYGDCVYVEKGGQVILSGATKMDELSFYTNSADLLTVSGNYTGTVTLKYPDTADLSNLTDIGNSMGGDVSEASITLYNAEGKTATVKGTDLVISDLPYTYGTCEACGDCQWVPIDDATLDSFGSSNMLPGHYILTEDVTTTQKGLNYKVEAPGTYCLDLAGHTFTGESRAFLVVGDARLNIFDTVGGGIVQGQTTDAVWGGVLYVNAGAQIHLYGGTVRHDTTRSEKVNTGGAVCARGGAFYLHGGTVEAAKVTGKGAAVMVTDYEGVYGSFTATGGCVTMGTAETAGPCIYVTQGCAVTLSGEADIAQLAFSGGSADLLTVDGSYSGSVELAYPSSAKPEAGTVIGKVSPAGDLSNAAITVSEQVCAGVVVSGDALTVQLDHTYDTETVAPTCTEGGYTCHTCTRCGDSYKTNETAALGHDYQDRVTTAPGCETEGVKTYTCANCGDTYTETLEATGHHYQAEVTAPTCTEGGYTTYTCACGHSYQAEQTSALGHAYETVRKDATCTEDGSVTDTCTRCGDTKVTTIPATGHSHQAEVTAPTCTEGGYTTYTCSCGDTYTADPVEATGHSYRVKTVAPTCTDRGYRRHTCTDCGYVFYDELLAALGHSYETVTVEATCTENGSITHTCTRCSHVETDVIPALGHDCDSVYTDAECTTPGYAYHSCRVCGYAFYDTVTPALGHSYSKGSCTVCGEKDPDYTVPVSYPTITLKYPTLVFEDVIMMNVYFAAEELQDVAEMGLITFTGPVEEWSIDNARYVIPGYSWSEADGLYYATTTGIAAKDLGDDIYFAVYARLTDGSYTYTRLVSYSPRTYAYRSLASGNAAMRPIVVAMLNYGAAAQEYFKYKTDKLLNAELTAEQSALVEAYRSDMLTAVSSPDAQKQGTLVSTGGFARRYPTVSFEGALCINYYATPSAMPEDGITMYYWSQEDYDAAQVLTPDNATASIEMNGGGKGEYHAAVEGIAAKDLDKGVYVCFVYSDGTTTYSSGVLAYSIGTYCSAQAAGTGTFAALAQATAVYGYYAKKLFY